MHTKRVCPFLKSKNSSKGTSLGTKTFYFIKRIAVPERKNSSKKSYTFFQKRVRFFGGVLTPQMDESQTEEAQNSPFKASVFIKHTHYYPNFLFGQYGAS